MKYWLLTLCTFAIQAQDFGLYRKDELIIEDQRIHTICSFEHVDYFSTFSFDGDFLWELPFRPRIISWKREGNTLCILSKMRCGSAFYLSCIDPSSGKVLWEKGIFPPQNSKVSPDVEEFGQLE